MKKKNDHVPFAKRASKCKNPKRYIGAGIPPSRSMKRDSTRRQRRERRIAEAIMRKERGF